MAALRFQLLYPQNTDKIQSVYMIISIGDAHRIRLRVPNVSIHPNQWDKAKGRVKMLKGIETKNELNSIIDEMEYKVKKVISDIEKRLPPATYEKINEAVKKIYPSNRKEKQILLVAPTKETEAPAKTTFWQFLESHIKGMETSIGKSGKISQKQTIKNYKNSFSCLKEFEEKYNKAITFESIDITLIAEYKTYLTIEKQHKPNTISGKVHKLCLLLENAHDKGLHNNMVYTRKDIQVKREQVENVYLNEKELAIIESYDFSANERLENVIDWFLIACWTGLAYCDCGQIKKELIKNNQIIIERKKTGQKTIVDITIGAIPAILAKRKGDFPKLITNQKFNEYIKEGLKAAGIKEPVTIYETVGGTRKSTTKEKYEFVAHHTARRSFATNMYLRDVPISRIMAHTGHSTEKEFMKYIKATQIEKQGDLKKYMV